MSEVVINGFALLAISAYCGETTCVDLYKSVLINDHIIRFVCLLALLMIKLVLMHLNLILNYYFLASVVKAP